MRRALTVLAGSMLAACSLLTSLDGYTGGAASTPDAALDAVTAAPDVATPPPPPSDAGADGSFCATSRPNATFCLDFEERGLAAADRKGAQNGTYRVDATASTSPPNALVASAAPTAAAAAFASVGHMDPRSVTDVVIELSSRIEQASTSDDIEIVHYAVGAWTLGMGVKTDGTYYVYEYTVAGPYASTFQSGPHAMGTWTRARLHLAITAAGSGTVDLDLDGTRLATGLSVAPPTATATSAELDVGVAYAAAGGQPWTLRFDDIVYDAR